MQSRSVLPQTACLTDPINQFERLFGVASINLTPKRIALKQVFEIAALPVFISAIGVGIVRRIKQVLEFSAKLKLRIVR